MPPGNLRMYIHEKSKPFPWRLRISFAIDIARALAYLHARKCIHRDLKGENLLVTGNGRLKITDFGFARIAARNEDQSKRLTFCGTDSYMSPEILLGDEFDLPTDIFSFGILLCEISARTLADEHHFKRTAPTFSIDVEEVHKLASPDCPPAFLALCLDCLAEDPKARPTTRVILERLRELEAEALLRPSEANDFHVGSVKFMAGKRAGAGHRIPNFEAGVAQDVRNPTEDKNSGDSDDELIEAVNGLDDIDLRSSWNVSSYSEFVILHLRSVVDRMAGLNGQEQSTQPLLANSSSVYSQYSTTVIRSQSPQSAAKGPPALSSILTIRPGKDLDVQEESLHPPRDDSIF